MKLFRNTTFQLVVAFGLISVDFQKTAFAEIHLHSTCNRGGVPKRNYGYDTQRFGASDFAVVTPFLKDGNNRRSFHFRATSIKVNHLQLDQIGLALDSDGQLVTSGRFTHSGGDGGQLGNNVTIRIRAFVGSSADPNQIPPDAVAVWSSECSLWVPRGQKHSALIPSGKNAYHSEDLKRNFERITHLEVEMEYRRDR